MGTFAVGDAAVAGGVGQGLNMNKLPIKRALLAVVVIVASLVFVYEIKPRPVPGAPPNTLTDLQQIDQLREQFNQDAGQVRLIMLVSPT
jgi:hypothetical protein